MVFSDAMGIYRGGFSTVTGIMPLTDDKLVFEGNDKSIRFVSGSPKKIEINLENVSQVKKDKERSIASFGVGIPVMKIIADQEYTFTNKLKDLRGSRQHSMDLWIEKVREAVEEASSE